MASDAAASAEMELAWHLLTVLLRLGRPAAASDLATAAAAAVSPHLIERLCRMPGSPLHLSGGVVTASETAVVAFLRFVGWDVSLPRVSLRASEVRRWWGKVPIRYERKRKASDAGRFGAKRRLLVAPNADLVEHKQQLIAQSCAPVATGEVHLEVMHELQDRLPTVDALIVEPSFKFSTGVTLGPSVAKIRMPGLQPQTDQFLGGHDGSVLVNMESALLPKELLNIPCCIDISSLGAEKSENIHAEADNEISRIGEPEGALPFYNCRVEDSDDLEKESILLPVTVEAALVGENKNGIDIPCCIDISSLGAEKSENIHAEADNEISSIGEPEGALPFYNCRVEDSDDLEKESILLPVTVEAALVGENKNGIEEDLNLICKRPGSPINCNTKAAANIEIIESIDVVPNQAEALQYDSPKAEYCEKIPSCGRGKNPLGANACAESRKNKTTEILFQSPIDTKVEPVERGANHEMIESLCQPSLGRKVEPAALPVEVMGYNCIGKRNLNIIAENKESAYLNQEEPLRNKVGVNLSKKEQDRKIVKQREKSKKNYALPKEDKDQLAAKAQKGHAVPKPLPNFKPFVIEEEEGSGGYGTVYRARRKSDGKVFAIKCPHAEAHSHHVNNELKMLERFGGKNFVIKYECSFKTGDLECFVLEHVEHDRPENLKKEIDVFELQWYGYCLFRALTSLHKQGIVHRDVKPGNFLFSRKLTKGYLIDFNLANDLHQFLRNCKSETISCGKDTVSQAALKSAPVVHAKEAVTDSNQPPVSKRKRSPNRCPVGGIPKIDNKSRHGSQAADVSGVTSAKDPTSTKTSLDRLKQPMPYKGRKELMNFLHEAMQSPNQNTSTAPVSQRKRVAAPFGNVDRKLFVLTPMPLCSGGSAVAGSGMFNSKGHGKHRKEGPCVGTKGFRAPEVLFRSFHQGCKVDVWSAGVTLLYLIIGKTPFGGDPEQNIKEIAKLRGSEELWEVAKLHNCESSYPSELFDVKLLHSVDLREWCAANTRRPDFLKLIPDSLFDLVDKCLAVNPRCRITSEDSLMHEFFAPCRESLRKQRMLRRSVVSDAACSSQDTMLTAKES